MNVYEQVRLYMKDELHISGTEPIIKWKDYQGEECSSYIEDLLVEFGETLLKDYLQKQLDEIGN